MSKLVKAIKGIFSPGDSGAMRRAEALQRESMREQNRMQREIDKQKRDQDKVAAGQRKASSGGGNFMAYIEDELNSKLG